MPSSQKASITVMKKISQYFTSLFKSEFKLFRAEVSIPEYIAWWIMRILLISVIIQWELSNKSGETDYPKIQIVQIWANLAGTFIVPVFRIIFPKQLFLGRLPYKTQKWATLICFSFCYFGHCLHLNGTTEWFDNIEHMISGFLMVFVCYQVALSMRHDKRELSPLVSSMCGFGLSCFSAIIWEIFEFITDYFVPGSVNQGYTLEIDDDFMFKYLFGNPANPSQVPLYDTMLDLMLGLSSAMLGAGVLWLYINKKQKSADAEAVNVSSDSNSYSCII